MSSFRQRLRQRRFPLEFRVPDPQSQPAVVVEPVPEPVPEMASPPSDLDDKTVADVATNLWRVLKRFGENGDGEASKAQRMAKRNLTAMSDRLSAAGVRAQDHDGMPWDLGMSLKAMAYEPRPNLERETVVDTVRPTVYRGGRCIQFGHVIVGVPEKGQDSGTGEH
nr:hypothetical protein [Kibdelosporangium sp. MJ126-NF4]CEL18225.1 hypothetical protein [Kibdelosporangium sp. MJ126-NF4]CTQ90544.1 hypothetical protein [Kibdelosporangium sp. MJ126-NF4]